MATRRTGTGTASGTHTASGGGARATHRARARRRIGAAACCAAGSVLLVACGTAPGGHAEDPADAAVVTYVPFREGGGTLAMTALTTGALAVRDGCVVVGDGLVVAFPDGTTWDGETLVVGDQTFRAGDRVSLGGGSIRVTETEGRVERLDVPAACSASDEVFVAGMVEPE